MRGPLNVRLMPLLLLLAAVCRTNIAVAGRQRRGLELSSVHHLIGDRRLTEGIQPTAYAVKLHPVLEDSVFSGVVQINLTVTKEQSTIEVHSHYDMVIKVGDIAVRELQSGKLVEVQRASRVPKKTLYLIRLKEPLVAQAEYELQIAFSGTIWDTAEGLFRGHYADAAGEKRAYLATHMRPNNARRLFPCMDEPQFKTPFRVSIARPRNYHTLFNTAVESTTDISPDSCYVLDHFHTTERMSTFAFGFVISQLTELVVTDGGSVHKAVDADAAVAVAAKPIVRIWARPDFHPELATLRDRVERILASVRRYTNVDYPLAKLDVVALPGFSALKPIDNWGLAVFKESDLSNNGYYLLAQELIYQWFGTWISPMWWSDAHINKAVVGLLAAQTSLEINNGQEFDGKWPMTQLYSIYYEFSKRYPHSRITGLKQETTCTKTELVLRMLNYTIGAGTFREGLRGLFGQRSRGLFHGEDVWNLLSSAAHKAGTLPAGITVNEIVGSWIVKDRLPVVTVHRDYGARTATATQKVYLRERPHDVPEQDKMLWWIPLVVVTQDRLDFGNFTPRVWLNRTREVRMDAMPPAEQFVIVNPEEIGPFPVNYDARNWNLLAAFLQTEEGRRQIPIYTRAKLLHDAWNLAYAGDLSFATAFNMTLFMKYEREHLVWNPVFTLIDHIGNHIDMSTVHKKFETYVRILLTPLYEELGPVAQEHEEKWKENLRSLARLFLCRAGYKPCIEEAQNAYRKWMESDNPDEGNPVPNQYICPVFKWGTQAEWEFGLQRVINFPASRKQSERTYLLKCLVGCPMQTAKIERLLRITILEENRNFTENDIFLEFNMLSSGSSGYINLFNFLSDNWLEIRERFANRTNLWDNLISSATGVFTTQEGYDMVAKLHATHAGEFGSAEHIIEKSLRNIKEETKWSAENLPVIEQWLDEYLRTAETAAKKFYG